MPSRRLFCLAVALLPALFSNAQSISRSDQDRDAYREEPGYYQKAYSDASDPQFMFTDGLGKLAIGFGGTVHVSGFFDFAGSLDSHSFTTSSIPVPTDRAIHSGYSTNSSNIYLKARSTIAGLKIIAYIEVEDNDTDTGDVVMISQAYVSLGSFTVGKTYSFFQDLEAGARTVDLAGPNTQVDRMHPLVGYTRKIGSRFSAALGIEKPSEISSKFKDTELVTAEYTRFPDVTAHFKYHGDQGHVQLGLIWRELGYWASNEGFEDVTKGKSVYKSGVGVALSGNLRPTDRLTLSGQVVTGKGISSYIRDLGGLNANMVEESWLDSDNNTVLAPTAAAGGFVAASYRWSEHFESSVIYGLCHIHKEENQYAADYFRTSHYAAANLFYFLTPNCYVGAEYDFGSKSTYKNLQTGAPASIGHANRFNTGLVYRF